MTPSNNIIGYRLHNINRLVNSLILPTTADKSLTTSSFPKSKDQKAHHQRFKEAAAYARNASRSKPIYAELAAGTMKNAYNIALSDWFHAPEIHRVEVKGGTVRIQASDNVLVAGVKVKILNEEGKILEQGEAVQADEHWWSYTPHAALEGKLKVEVEASDLARNITKEGMLFG